MSPLLTEDERQCRPLGGLGASGCQLAQRGRGDAGRKSKGVHGRAAPAHVQEAPRGPGRFLVKIGALGLWESEGWC